MVLSLHIHSARGYCITAQLPSGSVPNYAKHKQICTSTSMYRWSTPCSISKIKTDNLQRTGHSRKKSASTVSALVCLRPRVIYRRPVRRTRVVDRHRDPIPRLTRHDLQSARIPNHGCTPESSGRSNNAFLLFQTHDTCPS